MYHLPMSLLMGFLARLAVSAEASLPPAKPEHVGVRPRSVPSS